jgi:hypothetical protein
MPETPPRAVSLIPIELDKVRHLLIRKRDVRQAEQVFRQEIGEERTFFAALLQLLNALQRNDPTALSTMNICVLVWLSLRHEDPSLTLEDVEELLPLLSPADLIPIVLRLFEAWQAQSPVAPEGTQEAPAEPRPLDPSIGVETGPLPAYASVSATTTFGT